MAISRLAAGMFALSNMVFASGFSMDLGRIEVPHDTYLIHRLGPSASSLPEIEGKKKYWYGNFTVGKGKDVALLIDTGSTNLLLDVGIYKPSRDSEPYVQPNFTITYEGVDRSGGGFEVITGNVFTDIVSAGGLSLKDQPIGNITAFSTIDAPKKKRAISMDGIIGFNGKAVSSFGDSWFNNLCNQSLLSQCRFGIAFGTGGTGRQVIGKLDTNLYEGELTVAPELNDFLGPYTVLADVLLNGKVLFRNQTMFMDTGTNNIQSPLNQAKSIFKILGYTTTVIETNIASPFGGQNITTVTASFPCKEPPTLSLRFPAESVLKHPPASPPISKTSSLFDVFPSEWAFEKLGNGNCTAVLSGTNSFDFRGLPPPYNIDPWLIGQAFFAGHYVDHNQDDGTLGFANLKEPVTVA